MDTHYPCQHHHVHPRPDPAPVYEPPALAPAVIIVDLDGTVARRVPLDDGTMRCPWGTDHMLTDEPNQGVIDCLNLLANPFTGPELIFMTGRYEAARADTLVWLRAHFDRKITKLHMREDGNKEPDVDLKRRLYKTHIEGQYRVLWVFDDRAAVVRMWRSLGLLVFQVADGNF